MTSQNVFLKGNLVFLRAPEPGDIPMIARLENHPESRQTLFYALPTTLQQQRDKTDAQSRDPSIILLTICRIDNQDPIGQTAFVRIDWIGRMGIFYLGIADKENRLKGYGSETVRLMVDYAFRTLNFNRVELKVAAENTAAFNIYKKAGFRHEGTLRQAMYHEGRYSDFHVMGILRDDFEISESSEGHKTSKGF